MANDSGALITELKQTLARGSRNHPHERKIAWVFAITIALGFLFSYVLGVKDLSSETAEGILAGLFIGIIAFQVTSYLTIIRIQDAVTDHVTDSNDKALKSITSKLNRIHRFTTMSDKAGRITGDWFDIGVAKNDGFRSIKDVAHVYIDVLDEQIVVEAQTFSRDGALLPEKRIRSKFAILEEDRLLYAYSPVTAIAEVYGICNYDFISVSGKSNSFTGKFIDHDSGSGMDVIGMRMEDADAMEMRNGNRRLRKVVIDRLIKDMCDDDPSLCRPPDLDEKFDAPS